MTLLIRESRAEKGNCLDSGGNELEALILFNQTMALRHIAGSLIDWMEEREGRRQARECRRQLDTSGHNKN